MLSGSSRNVPETTLAELFSSQVAKTPDAVALTFRDDRLTYAELDARAERLADVLVARGVRPERVVGVALARSVDLVVALLAIHKAGAAYLPLDTGYPAERLAFMIGDAEPVVVLADRDGSGILPVDAPLLLVDELPPAEPRPRQAADPGNPAYVIYTSGSTGRPKGVVVTHRAIVNRLEWMQAEYGLSTEDRVLQKTPSSFDVSVWEFFWPLITGATLVVAVPGGHQDPGYLAEVIQAEQVTTLHFVPSMLWAFLAEPKAAGCTSLRRVICSGEALPAELAARFHEVLSTGLHNLYGPTEAAVDVTYWPCSPEDDGPVPIGFPVWNTGLRVLDPRLRPVGEGVLGELYLTGVQLARGYLGRFALTAERFVADPFGAPGDRMYRTGDLARSRPDGAIEYAGRVDSQVKIRGFRVELGEIEAVLGQAPGVEQAAVVVRENGPGNQLLVGYYVGTDAGIAEFASSKLPEHMVPPVLVRVDEMPLSANGKLDRGALPAPDFAALAGDAGPDTEREKLLCDVFAEVLGLPKVGAEDSFFSLGGDSILAVRLSRRLNESGLACGPRELFGLRTPRALAAALTEAVTAATAEFVVPDIEAGEDEVLPLAPLAEGLLYQCTIAPGGNAYIVQLLIDLDAGIDAHRLRAAADSLLERHSILRAGFRYADDGTPAQIIAGSARMPWRTDDLANAQAVADEDRDEPFDLAAPPLVRMSLLQGADRSRLVFTMHHLVIDGWSLPVLVRDLFAAYEGTELPAAPAYRDFLSWLAARDLKAAAHEWGQALSDLDGPTLLAPGTDVSTPEVLHDVHLDESATTALADFARARGLTLNTVLQGVWGFVLGRLTGKSDVVFGTTVSGRPADLSGVESMVGLFVNTVPVRVRLDPWSPAGAALDAVQAEQARLFDHHHLPLAEIQRIAAVGELFDTLLVFENYPLDGFGTSIRAVERRDATHYPLSLTVVPGERMLLRFAHRLDTELVERISAWLVEALRSIVAEPSRPLGAIEVQNAAERAESLGQRHETVVPLPPVTLTEVFESTAAARPDDIAVVAGSSRLTFAELNARANRLARLLKARGVGSEDVVALGLPRTGDFMVGLLAVLKAGAAFLPLSADHPEQRIAYQFADAKPVFVLTTSGLTWPAGCEQIVLDDLAGHEAGNLTPPSPADPAYVIYTSGSTGQPKGVVVTHAGLANLFHAHLHGFITPEAAGERWRTALVASPVFDTFWEPVLWLVAGHELHLLDDEVRLDADALVAYVRTERVDLLDVTPSYAPQLIGAGLLTGEHRPRVVMLGGEAAGPALWTTLREAEGVRGYNYYGPTEVTVDALGCRIADFESPVIGLPLANLHAYILDSALRPVPVGVAGELYLAGPSLARGYLGRTALTAQRFVADPFGDNGSRMYRTGDLVRRLPGGEVEYLGRTDDQVKIRGIRVELGEIEAVLNAHPDVRAAAVLAHTQDNDTRLVAYVVTSADAETLRAHVQATLPSQLVPSAFVLLDALPLTVNGKLDRAALPAPDFAQRAGGRAAGDPREQVLCDLFADVLGVTGVGIDDDFFALGGHSLLATRLVSRIRRVLDVELPIRALFDTPTVAALALSLDGSAGARPPLRPVTRPEQVPLSFAQQRLWFLDRFDGPSATYNIPVAFRLPADIDAAMLRRALADVVGRHESLRTVFVEADGVGTQRILEQAEPSLDVHEVHGDLTAELTRLAQHRFDLGTDIPLRAWLCTVDSEDPVLLLLVHHIAADEWSMGPLVRDLRAAYAARSEGREPDWAELPVQYADYTLWQRDLLSGSEGGQLTYWKSALAGLPEQLDLPYDRQRPAAASYLGETVPFRLEADVHARLRTLAARTGVSVFMLVQAGLAALLTRLGAGTDIPIGSPVAGRTDAALDELVGFFVNNLVLRTDTSGDPMFRELLGRVRTTDLAAFENQDVPFERVVDAVNPARSLARHPLFQVMLVHHSAQDAAGEWAELPAVDVGVSKVDLTVYVTEEPGGVAGLLEYSRDLFDRTTAEAFARRLTMLLEAAIDGPDRRIGDLEVLFPEEEARLVAERAEVAVEVPARTLPELVAAQAAATPDAIAVVAGGVELTYAELERQASHWAAVLAARGAGRDRIVAVALPRTAELLVGLLAVLKTGATYLPLDLEYPADRISYMLDDAQPVCVLTHSDVASRVPFGQHVLMDAPATAEPRDLPVPAGADAAYVIYTSGSTGKPKGVVIPHSALVNFLLAMQDRLGFGAGDRLVAVTTVGFDIAGLELFLPLLSGARVVIASRDTVLDPSALLDLVSSARATTVQATPTLWQALVSEAETAGRDAVLRDLRVLVGGEALPPALAERLLAVAGDIFNVYGPTETTIWSTAPTSARRARPSARRSGTRRSTCSTRACARCRPVCPASCTSAATASPVATSTGTG
nr:AMP-dependent synthetase and ligase [uncultured bacterium]